MFIYDEDNLFNYDGITPEDKKFIMDIIDRIDFNSDKQIFNGDEDTTIEIVDENTEIKKENEEDEINEGEKEAKEQRRIR